VTVIAAIEARMISSTYSFTKVPDLDMVDQGIGGGTAADSQAGIRGLYITPEWTCDVCASRYAQHSSHPSLHPALRPAFRVRRDRPLHMRGHPPDSAPTNAALASSSTPPLAMTEDLDTAPCGAPELARADQCPFTPPIDRIAAFPADSG